MKRRSVVCLLVTLFALVQAVASAEADNSLAGTLDEPGEVLTFEVDLGVDVDAVLAAAEELLEDGGSTTLPSAEHVPVYAVVELSLPQLPVLVPPPGEAEKYCREGKSSIEYYTITGDLSHSFTSIVEACFYYANDVILLAFGRETWEVPNPFVFVTDHEWSEEGGVGSTHYTRRATATFCFGVETSAGPVCLREDKPVITHGFQFGGLYWSAVTP